MFVGALLVTVATLILVAFDLLERSVRARLESFGLNTIVAREMIMQTDPEMLPNIDRPDRLAPLEKHGERIRLRHLFSRAQHEWQGELNVLSYPPESYALLRPYLAKETPLVCLSETWPEGGTLGVTFNRQSGLAAVRRPGTFLRPLMSLGNVLLIPQGWAPEAERAGFIETTIFQRSPDAAPVKDFLDGVNLAYTLDHRNPPQLQSALPMIRELESLQQRQTQWRGLMAGLLGLALALVYGAIAVLEFRANLFIGALLRSFGAPGRFLYFRQWIENAFLANLAALLAIGGIAAFHAQIFGALGFSRDLLDLKAGNPYLGFEIALILAWVNIGAFLSSLPVAFGLKRQVGEILT